jgi:AraC-like DNA-binding protein
VGERNWRLEGKWFWSAYPGPRISFHVAEGHKTWRHRYIAFRGPLVERWEAEGLFPIAPPQPAPRDEDFGDRFDALLALATRGDKWSARRAVHLLEGILIELAEERARSDGQPPWLRSAIERFSEAATGGAIDYDAVAAELGMAQSTLRRRFRAAMGVPPHEFVLQQRVGEARRLLGETDLPIKSIAQKLGYRDVYFFSRQFRRLAGVPPALYRKSRQA